MPDTISPEGTQQFFEDLGFSLDDASIYNGIGKRRRKGRTADHHNAFIDNCPHFSMEDEHCKYGQVYTGMLSSPIAPATLLMMQGHI